MTKLNWKCQHCCSNLSWWEGASLSTSHLSSGTQAECGSGLRGWKEQTQSPLRVNRDEPPVKSELGFLHSPLVAGHTI